MKLLPCVLLLIASLAASARGSAPFPQEHVNEVILAHRQDKREGEIPANTPEHGLPLETSDSGLERHWLSMQGWDANVADGPGRGRCRTAEGKVVV